VRGRLLIVEDRDSLRRMLERALGAEGYRVESAADGEEGVRRVADAAYDLVLTDLKLPGRSGLEVLAASRAAQPDTPVVVLTGYGTVAAAVEAMKLGAHDFLEKPVEIDDLFRLVAAAIGPQPDDQLCLRPPGAPPVVGRHPSMRAAARRRERVAPTDATGRLTGECGTGEALVARALGARSARRGGGCGGGECAALGGGRVV
jgi:DNA-binding NtrC family response regulator